MTSTVDGSWSAPGTTAPPPAVESVLGVRRQLCEALKGFDPEWLTLADKHDLLIALSDTGEIIELLRGRLLAASDDVAAAIGSRNPVTWLAGATRTDTRTHQRARRLAERLEDWPLVRAAVEDRAVNPDQAWVIVRCLDALIAPGVDLGEHRDVILHHAQTTLIGECASKTPAELKILGGRILDHVAPHLAEEEERKRLERQDALARAGTRLFLYPLGKGLTRIEGQLPDHIATRLATYLDAYTNPRRPCTCGADADPQADAFAHHTDCAGHASSPSTRAPGDIRDSAQRRGAAFCQFLEAVDPTRLPTHGNDTTTVVITMPLQHLVSGLGGADLPDGTRLSASEVRRLACNAALIPAVLGTDSEPLDLGRSARLFSPGQRRALGLLYRECQAARCTIPARWCEAHHVRWWQHDGPTDLDNATLLCNFHHHRVHDPAYEHRRDSDGAWHFMPRRH